MIRHEKEAREHEKEEREFEIGANILLPAVRSFYQHIPISKGKS